MEKRGAAVMSRKASDVFVVSISGNIASRKTTVGNLLKEMADNIVMLEEPWQQNLFLSLFYQDKKRWAYATQMEFFLRRTRLLLETMEKLRNTPNSKKIWIVLQDRSVYDDRYVFAQALYESGLMTEEEYASYLEFWNYWAKQFGLKPDLFIYLKQDAELCFQFVRERALKQRGNLELQQDGVSLDYLRILHRYYEKMFEYLRSEVPIIEINMNELMPLDYDDHAEKIKTLFKEKLYELFAGDPLIEGKVSA